MKRFHTIATLALIFVLPLAMIGCSSNGQKNGETAESPKPATDAEGLELTTTNSGLRYADLVEGQGAEATNGTRVKVHYTLWLDNGGEKGQRIQSSKDSNRPFPFTVGQQGLIQGWNEGMLGMKQGGTRRLYIPSNIGYGQRGMPPAIPPNADLIFEIELLEIL